jgi:hypothetical protein
MTKQAKSDQSNIASKHSVVAITKARSSKAPGPTIGVTACADNAPLPATEKSSSTMHTAPDRAIAGSGERVRMTKQEIVLTLLSQTAGVSIEEIMVATGWQQHSVRGFFAGTVKKKLGFNLVSNREGTEARRYRIEARGRKEMAR